MAQGIKHLIKCRCFLPQFKSQQDPPIHQFIVFSVLDDTDQLVSKLVQCNNCGIVHKVTDVCKSQIMNGRENLQAMVTIDDLKGTMPEQLVAYLETNSVDLATWEQANWILENKLWGDFIVLSSDTVEGVKQGKILRILGEKLYKVDVFSREEFVSGETP